MPNTDQAQGVQIISSSGVATEFGGGKTFNIALNLDALDLNTYLLVFVYLLDGTGIAYAPDSVTWQSDTFTLLFGTGNGFYLARIIAPTAANDVIAINCTSPNDPSSICYGHIAFRNVNQTTPEILASLNTDIARGLDTPVNGADVNMEALSILFMDSTVSGNAQAPTILTFGQRKLIEVWNDPHNTSILAQVSIANINGNSDLVRNFHWAWSDGIPFSYVNLILDAEPFYHEAGTIHT